MGTAIDLSQVRDCNSIQSASLSSVPDAVPQRDCTALVLVFLVQVFCHQWH